MELDPKALAATRFAAQLAPVSYNDPQADDEHLSDWTELAQLM